MDLVEHLYAKENIDSREVWSYNPFGLLSPEVPFLGYKLVRQAIEHQDQDFFLNNIRNNFLPDKDEKEVLEGKRYAINRGIETLNMLCATHLPEAYKYLEIKAAPKPYNPLQVMTQAREKWIIARNGVNTRSSVRSRILLEENGEGMHKGLKDPTLLFDAYDAVRAWGLGHFALIVDESPEIYNSVRIQPLVDRWFFDRFEFTNPQQRDKDSYTWDTNAGIQFVGTRDKPFRRRAKIYDEFGNIQYGSLYMKMFLKKGFLDSIQDTYGVELVVPTDRDVEKLISHFRHKVRATSSLEQYQVINQTEPPVYKGHKFILRIPIRVYEQRANVFPPPHPDEDRCLTESRPLEKYIRVPVEVQVRAADQPIDHKLYKKLKFMQVFPLWYPRAVYEPILQGINIDV